jgi:dihydrofolate reductase
MRTMIYSMSVTLDGYIADPDGAIDWAAPDDDLMAFHVEQTRELQGHLCGRGLYEDMLPWEERDNDFARLWQAVPKVVFSTTLDTVAGNATVATGTVADEVAKMKEGAGRYVSVGGAGLAAALIEQDLIDEYRLFVNPVILGGGTSFFSEHPDRLELELTETRTFSSGVVYLNYRRTGPRDQVASGVDD